MLRLTASLRRLVGTRQSTVSVLSSITDALYCAAYLLCQGYTLQEPFEGQTGKDRNGLRFCINFFGLPGNRLAPIRFCPDKGNYCSKV